MKLNRKVKIITISNQKGGVGKTTMAITIGHGLARKGNNVLIVDLDPQGGVASYLDVPLNNGAYLFLTLDFSDDDAINQVRNKIEKSPYENLYVLPGNKMTVLAQQKMEAEDVTYIRDRLPVFCTPKWPDYIILDTPSSIGGIQEFSLWAADYLIIPAAPEMGSLLGIINIIKDLEAMANMKPESRRWKGKVAGVILNEFEDQLTACKDAQQWLEENIGGILPVLPPIHKATLFRQSLYEKKTIFDKAPGSRAGEEYSELVDIVQRLI